MIRFVQLAASADPGRRRIRAMHRFFRSLLWQTWRLIILVFGITLVLLGIALMVLPGPGLLTSAIGIAVLAAEFAWARRLLRRAHGQLAGYYSQYERWRGIARPLPRVYEFRLSAEDGDGEAGPLALKAPRDWLERHLSEEELGRTFDAYLAWDPPQERIEEMPAGSLGVRGEQRVERLKQLLWARDAAFVVVADQPGPEQTLHERRGELSAANGSAD